MRHIPPRAMCDHFNQKAAEANYMYWESQVIFPVEFISPGAARIQPESERESAMRSNQTFAIVVVCILLSATFSSAGTTTEIQTFDSAATAAGGGWTGHLNTTPPQNYGWRSTNLAAGAMAGEAGGDFTDGDTAVSYYADTTINGPITGEKLSASGKLGLISGASDRVQTQLGHFDSTVLTGNANAVGIRLADSNSAATI